MIRAAWAWLWTTATQYAPEGTLRWHVLTWCGHTLVSLTWAVLGIPGAGVGYYTMRELEQRFLSHTDAPWWDSVGDIAGPWLVWWLW